MIERGADAMVTVMLSMPPLQSAAALSPLRLAIVEPFEQRHALDDLHAEMLVVRTCRL